MSLAGVWWISLITSYRKYQTDLIPSSQPRFCCDDPYAYHCYRTQSFPAAPDSCGTSSHPSFPGLWVPLSRCIGTYKYRRILTYFTQSYICLLPKLHIHPLLKVELFFTCFLTCWKLYNFWNEELWYISCEPNSQVSHPSLNIWIVSGWFCIKFSPDKKCGCLKKMRFSLCDVNQLLQAEFRLSIDSY